MLRYHICTSEHPVFRYNAYVEEAPNPLEELTKNYMRLGIYKSTGIDLITFLQLPEEEVFILLSAAKDNQDSINSIYQEIGEE